MPDKTWNEKPWSKVEELFLTALELPAAERAAFFDRECGLDLELREEAESLLAADAANGQGIAFIVEDAAASLFERDAMTGKRLGAYQVVREIGRGGMGVVYLAIRADQAFERSVAVKVVKRGVDTDAVLGRFRHERRILAGLDHPYIARLMDGGTSADGRPYFVMEYVEGRPIQEFCQAKKLSIRERCQLFRKVCEPVSYAHRNLVIHRDLKPANILITEEGSPKLLDFGIARLLNLDPGENTLGQGATASSALTPAYASPEQRRGEAVNTATDVYSLGAVLFEILSGQAPPANRDLAVPCAIGKPSEVVPERSLRSELAGDLDNIVLKATHAEQERRYQSVDHLSEDLDRYLTGRPVQAREDSFGYRARKFVRRNRFPIALAGLFVAVLIGGATTALLQARRAVHEQILAEQQRRIAIESQARAEASRQEAERQTHEAELQRIAAETQRQIADHRFEQVRQLAGKFLLEFHDSIAKLPGSTMARKMVVETGLKYYDTLVKDAVKDARGNRDLLEEIARGYDRLGDAQGNTYFANLGDSAGAIASYEKALAIRQSISDPSPQFLLDRIGGAVKLAQVSGLNGDLQRAERTLRDAQNLGEQSSVARTYAVRQALANAYRTYGDIHFRTGDYAKSIQPYSKDLELRTALAREKLDPLAEQAGLSMAHTKLGDAYARLNHGTEALQHVRIAIQIDQPLAAADRNNVSRLRKLFLDYSAVSIAFRTNESLAAPGEAIATLEATAELAGQMVAADPNNNTALFDVLTAEGLFGDWLREHNDAPGAVIHYRKAVDSAEKFASTGPPALFTLEALIYVHQRLASGLGRTGQLEEALEHCRKAEEYAARAEERNPGMVSIASRRAYIATTRAQAYATVMRWKEAIAAFTSADLLFNELHKREPKTEAFLLEQMNMDAELADCYAATEQWTKASQAMQSGLDRFGEVASLRPLLASEEELRKAALAKLAIWKQK